MTGRPLLVFAACLVAFPLITACGSSGANKTLANAAASSTIPPNDPRPSPEVKPPVSRFAVNLDDLGTQFITNVSDTYELTAKSYGATAGFDSPSKGEQLLNSWGYEGGYETSFRPEGGQQSLLQAGSYYLSTEVHLFKTVNGASQAFTYFKNRIHSSGAEVDKAAQLGNESAGFSRVQGKIAGSSIDAVYESFIFRRGNVVGIVLAYGASGFMNINIPRQAAVFEDNKILGKSRAPVPTPITNFTPNPYDLTSTPVPSATPTP